MVRDGRATVNSIISRKVTITGFDLTSYRQSMSKWNQAIETMHKQCKEIGHDQCMMVSLALNVCCVHTYIIYKYIWLHLMDLNGLPHVTTHSGKAFLVLTHICVCG